MNGCRYEVPLDRVLTQRHPPTAAVRRASWRPMMNMKE